jgi:hypothetical protein
MSVRIWAVLALLFISSTAWAEDQQQDYLYERDVIVPAFQTLREFFDMPNHPGNYEVTLVSDAIGPLTFRVIRVKGEREHTIKHKRSYQLRDHVFHATFRNPLGSDDLIVEIANSNPAVRAKVSVYVVQLPEPDH